MAANINGKGEVVYGHFDRDGAFFSSPTFTDAVRDAKPKKRRPEIEQELPAAAPGDNTVGGAAVVLDGALGSMRTGVTKSVEGDSDLKLQISPDLRRKGQGENNVDEIIKKNGGEYVRAEKTHPSLLPSSKKSPPKK